MTALEFISAMTSALIWPVFALVLVLVFRGGIKGWLAERPTRFRAGPIEAEWDREAAKVGAAIEEASTSAQPAQPTDFGQLSPTEVVELAQSSPTGAVVEASKAIERELRAKLADHGRHPVGPLSVEVKRAQDARIISAHLAESIHSLRRMRNMAVHSSAVTAAQAVEFLVLTQAVLMQLRGTSWPDLSTSAG